MKRRNLFKISIIFLIFLYCIELPVFADVGDFESYDSGWSSSYDSGWDSSSSWDSDYGWGSSYYYDDDYYGYSGRNSDFIIFMIFIIIVLVAIYIVDKHGINNRRTRRPMTENDYIRPMQTEQEVINRIKVDDELFNEVEFSSWVRDLFVKLQYAWSDRDWSAIRYFETTQLYEQHYSQLQRYIKNKQINKMERVSVNWVKYFDYVKSGDKDVLTVILNSKMVDYIVDEATNQIIKGDPNSYKINNYKLTFIRKTGIKTKPGEMKLNVTNCPNCGAPTEITSAGKCEYCGSVITTGEYNWVLSNLERYNGLI